MKLNVNLTQFVILLSLVYIFYRYKNSEWANLNPCGMGGLDNTNLLQPPSSMIGINTQGSSLRNANLQLRSEPVIPKVSVGPFLNSTIDPDCSRLELEIGPPTC
mgnify:CR=1 FL=1